MNDEQKLAALKKAESDLKYMLDKEDVEEDIQCKFFHIGITGVRHFAAFASTIDEFKAALKEGFGLDPGGGFADRVRVAKLVVSWEAAKARSSKAAEIAAENDAREIPKPLPTTEFIAMREAFEKLYGSIADEKMPARSYLEKLLDHVEKNDLGAESLEDVLSQQDDKQDNLQPLWDTSGHLKAVKISKQVPLPTNTEELRDRFELMSTAWIMVACKHTHRAYFKGLTEKAFTNFVKYILGPYVYGLKAEDDRGNVVATPPWRLVLAYEKAMRVEAMKLIRSGHTLAVALELAAKDTSLKDRFFITPMAVAPVKRQADSSWEDNQKKTWVRRNDTERPGGRGKGGGKGKDKGKDKTQRNNNVCARMDDQKKPICFKFNRGNCKVQSCPYEHVCGVCFKPGVPMKDCDHSK